MAGTKNNEQITLILMRIFYYAPQDAPMADQDKCENRIKDFVKYLRQRGFEISPRSMYGYVEGTQHMPGDFYPHLRDWSLDTEFMQFMGMTLPKSEHHRMREKIRKEKEARDEHQKKIDEMEATLQ